MIIGLSGFANVGKDEVGKILIERHGFKRISFASKLKDCLYALNPIITHEPGVHSRLVPVVDLHGWDIVKERYPEVRELLQRLGTEVGRNILGENIWVDAAFKDYDAAYSSRSLNGPRNYVVTDLRFPNEFEGIKKRGGLCARIRRPGYVQTNQHVSETALDEHDFDYVLDNSSDLVYLEHQVEHLLAAAGVQ